MYSLKDFGVTKEVGVLKNGTRVILFRKEGVPISTHVAFQAGSRFDPIGKEGLAHFTEHVLFQKTKMFADTSEMAAFLEKAGGYTNAGTDPETIQFIANIAESSDYSRVVTVVNEMFNNLIIESKNVEVERSVILKEIADRDSNPQSYVGDLVDELIFQGSGLSRHTLGNNESVANITKEDAYNFYKERLNTESMIIVVSGDITLEQLLLEYNKGLVSEQKAKTIFLAGAPLPIIRKKSIAIKKYTDTDNLNIIIGFRICSLFDSDFIPLQVIATVCASGFTSSLFRKLRQEAGLVYDVSADTWGFTDAGAWLIFTSTPKNNLQKLLDIVCCEFKRVYDGKITEEELKLAKDKMLKFKKHQMQSSSSWVEFHVAEELFNPKNPKDLDKYMNSIQSITLEDLARVGKKYFKEKYWYLAICGDIEEKDIKVNY
jgi:predicted Zn-dependent peptidase